MNDLLRSLLAFILGLVLGAQFFAGLWLTVRKALASKIPALWVVGSLFVRMGITVLGFYFIASHGWPGMLMCLAGFILARIIVLRITKEIDANNSSIKKEENHET